jgi:hypothetical protein
MNEPAALSGWPSFLLERPQESSFPIVAFGSPCRLNGVHEDCLHGTTIGCTSYHGTDRNDSPVAASDQKAKDWVVGVFVEAFQRTAKGGPVSIGTKVETYFEATSVCACYQCIHTGSYNV